MLNANYLQTNTNTISSPSFLDLAPTSQKTLLRDRHSRTFTKLRISLTDACQFRCFYCLPQPIPFLPSQEQLTPLEFKELASVFVELGVTTIRVTGGEPTIRPDFLTIVEKLAELNINSNESFLKLTTNGERLKNLLPQLYRLGCKNINISLDSLDPQTFFEITGRKTLLDILDNIQLAQNLGFRLKINVVVGKGHNDHELISFVQFAERENLEVRFLELMNLGAIKANYTKAFMAAPEMKKIIETYTSLIPRSQEEDSTSQNFSTQKGAQIGFIAPESQPFCGSCSRLRLTAKGIFRSCLMHEEGIDLRGFHRQQVKDKILQHIHTKPIQKLPESKLSMNQIGG